MARTIAVTLGRGLGTRDNLVLGVDKPSAATTGTIPGSFLTPSSGDITVTTAGTVLQSLDISGRVIVNAANVSIKNCRIRGINAAPVGDTFLVTAIGASVSNLLVEDCEIAPDFPHWNWDSGITGHDFTARRCNIYNTTDGINTFNTNATSPYNVNVTIDQCWIHDLGWWTAAAGGVVHPSDVITHNDIIQHQGGFGLVVRGNRFDSAYARQYGHWVVTNPSVEPYVQVPLNSLPDGGAYQALRDRGTGTAATGRYNWLNLSVIQIGNNVGDAYAFTFTDNWCYGGAIGINAGSLAQSGTQNLGDFLRNRFDRTQGQQSTGGDNTYTVNINASWSGFVNGGVGTGNANTYEDTGTPVNFRVNA